MVPVTLLNLLLVLGIPADVPAAAALLPFFSHDIPYLLLPCGFPREMVGMQPTRAATGWASEKKKTPAETATPGTLLFGLDGQHTPQAPTDCTSEKKQFPALSFTPGAARRLHLHRRWVNHAVIPGVVRWSLTGFNHQSAGRHTS
jgi:hypothetical protein